MAQYIKSALLVVPSRSRIFHQHWQSIRSQWCHYCLWQFVRSARFLLKVPWVQRSQILHRWRVICREVHSWPGSADWYSQLCGLRDQSWYQRHHCGKWSHGSQNNQTQQIWIHDWSQICWPLSCPPLQKFMPNRPWFCRLQVLRDWVQKGNHRTQPLQYLLVYLDVYGYCYYNDSFDATQKKDKKRQTQESILLGIQKHFSDN